MTAPDMVGASLTDMDELTAKLNKFTTELNQLKAAASAVVTKTTWKGRNADKFRATWELCTKNINAVEKDLAEAAKAVKTERSNIALATGS